ncbi:MAG TPA: hypothetical protein VGP72_26515 [Planctomycetota bacterium]|jgi:hypothetical protein
MPRVPGTHLFTALAAAIALLAAGTARAADSLIDSQPLPCVSAAPALDANAPRLMQLAWVGDGAKWWGDQSMWASLQLRLTDKGIAAVVAKGGSALVLEHRTLSWTINEPSSDTLSAGEVEAWYVNSFDAAGADYAIRMDDGLPSLYFAAAELRIPQLLAYPDDDPQLEVEVYRPKTPFTQGAVTVDVNYFLLTYSDALQLGLTLQKKATAHSVTWPESQHLPQPIGDIDSAAIELAALSAAGTRIRFSWNYAAPDKEKTVTHCPLIPPGPQRDSHGW